MQHLCLSTPLRDAALSAAVALALAGCGGGGGYVRPAITGTPAPPTNPVTPPTTPSGPEQQPPIDAQLAITDAYAAHAQGYDGAGVVIGFVDSGIMRNHPALAGRVAKELVYVDPSRNNLAVDDVIGHGTMVAEIAAGVPIGKFAGGLAPGATLVAARVIDDAAPSDNGTRPPAVVTPGDAVPLGQVAADLVAAGVQVMNNSWGGITWSSGDTATTQGFRAAYGPFVNTWGGLVVFAAGNGSQANPSTIAALPTLAPELEKGWLAVVAVDSNHPGQLASYSNKCGVAADYCLAAPGGVVVSGKDDTATSLSYYVATGTSLATPQVSGAAALVWQAYPYFSNDLVRQTLLGTADDLGAPGVDPVFGYGELNAGRAVNGPMQFNWGDVTVNFTGDSSWNNPISGAGGLVKQGTGSLVLTAPSTYAGMTQVQGGSLRAQSLAGDVQVGAAGTLDGTPSVAGDVLNAGVLAVHGGDTAIGGGYTQQAGGRLAVSLGSALRVAGAAAIQGGDLYVLGTDSGYVANAHTEVLSAGGGLTGAFSALDKASNVTLLTASVQYDANTAWLDVTQVAASAVPGLTYTAATSNAAQRVDGAFAQINTQLAAAGAGAASAAPVATDFMRGAADLQRSASASVVGASLDSLSGQLHAASAALTFAAIDAGTRALSDRLDALREQPQTGGWATDLARGGGLARSGYSPVAYDLSGALVGADQRIGASGVAGYAISRSAWLGQLAGRPDQGRSRAIEGMLYAGTLHGDWYAMGRFGVGNYRQTMHRQIRLGDSYAGVGSDSRGRYGVAGGETGYRLGLGGGALTPYASLQYARIERSGFDEAGAYGFGLRADAHAVARWQAGIGMRAAREWALASGGALSVQVRALWQQAFGLRGDVFDGSFSGIQQLAPLPGIGLSRRGAVLGTTLQWQLSPRAGLRLAYDRYGGQYETSSSAMASLRVDF
ncbi:MAG: S8 family serine peptidase [Xanthomonadales bacterium]|nr:S8 family serine peptidase [Xanthomonadales bacterium]